ncbi:hypothetical protein HY640_01450 [Candidatus Woesearchaeota archaeon]|nr:hypothetical protein [Candidatus Woesearchaeota archaeon]
MGTIPDDVRPALLDVARTALEEFVSRLDLERVREGMVPSIVDIHGLKAYVAQVVNSAYMRSSEPEHIRGHRVRREISEIIDEAAKGLGFEREYVMETARSPVEFHASNLNNEYSKANFGPPRRQAISIYYHHPSL